MEEIRKLLGFFGEAILFEAQRRKTLAENGIKELPPEKLEFTITRKGEVIKKGKLK